MKYKTLNLECFLFDSPILKPYNECNNYCFCPVWAQLGFFVKYFYFLNNLFMEKNDIDGNKGGNKIEKGIDLVVTGMCLLS